MCLIDSLHLLQDTPDYVAYVAKDPVNQRGLHTSHNGI